MTIKLASNEANPWDDIGASGGLHWSLATRDEEPKGERRGDGGDGPSCRFRGKLHGIWRASWDLVGVNKLTFNDPSCKQNGL